MGGKHKQGQRAKNNARPSSSGRSAELLGSTIPQFVGFSSVKETGLVLPGLSYNPEMDNTLDSNFQLLLKKMNKKDATTKLKGLQEFTELTKKSEPDVVKSVLPFWPRLFCILATDTDHRVREAVHIAHLQVVTKVKKNLAPYLKQIIGPWFAGQYDTYAPSASAATQSFQSVFPGSKVKDAIIFCQEEILTYICDNLTVHTAQTLSNPKTTSPEDAEAKYQRILISSLHGYALYLKQLPSDKIKAAEELNRKIICNNRFWKIAKHNVAPIRAAFFTAITALCEKGSFLLNDQTGNLVNCVFANLDENEPIVLPLVWEAALAIFLTIKDWWTFVNVEKVMLPKLWNFLRDAGQGNAARIFPNLLPLVSHLPSILTDINSVYCNFFENMRIGLKRKTVLESRSESTAVAKSFIECLKYVIMKNQSELALCERLIKNQLITVLELGLTDSQTNYKVIFNQITGLIQYWSRNRESIDTPNYKKYLQYFWHNVDSLFEGLLLNFEHNYDRDSLIELTNRQIDFLLSLKSFKEKKSVSVSFEKMDKTDSITSTSKQSTDEDYSSHLNDLVLKTCRNFVKLIQEKKSKDLIENLVKLVKNFESFTFFENMSELFHTNQNTIILIYTNLLKTWLQDVDLCCESVVNLVFLLFTYLSPEDKDCVIKDFIKPNHKHCLGWCINQVLSKPYNSNAFIDGFFNNLDVQSYLLDLIEAKLQNTCTPESDLVLKKVFAVKASGELYVTKNTIRQIIDKLNLPLTSPNMYPMAVNECANFAAYITTIIFTKPYLFNIGEGLLINLFTFSLNYKQYETIVNEETLEEVNNAWHYSVSILCVTLSGDSWHRFVEKFAKIIENQFCQEGINFILQQRELVVQFLICTQSANPLRIDKTSKWFFLRDFLPKWKCDVENHCKKLEYLTGQLACPYEMFNYQSDEIDEDIVVKYFIWMDLIAEVLMSRTTDDDELFVCNLVETEEFLLDIIYAVVLSDSYYNNNFTFKKYSNYVKEKSESLKTHTVDLFKQHPECLKVIEEQIVENVNSDNWLWIKTLNYFYTNVEVRCLSKIYGPFTEKSLVLLQLTQVIAKHLHYTDIPYKLPLIDSIITLRSLIEWNRELEIPISEMFTQIEALQLKNRALFLYESAAINTITWYETELIIEIIRLYTEIIKHKVQYVGNRWDLITIPISVWTTNIVKQKTKYENLQISAFMVALSDLLVAFSNYLTQTDNKTIVEEWRDVFVQDLHKDIVDLWVYLSNEFESTTNISTQNSTLIQHVGNVLVYLDWTYIFVKRPEGMPKWLKLIQIACGQITHRSSVIQLWSYHMLRALLSGLVGDNQEAVNANRPHEKGLILEQFKANLLETQDILQVALQEFKLGEDSCRIQPFTDSYTFAFAHFLIWDIVLSLCENASSELRFQYADWIKSNEFLTNLMGNIFKLIPLEVLQNTETKSKKFADLFITQFCYSFSEAPSSERIEHMVCWIYSRTLAQLPALVRQWWSARDSRTAQFVEKITSTYISPQLCTRELNDVAQHENTFKNMVIKVHQNAREVVAVYTVDEAQMELMIKLPVNYPLGSPEVECNRQICGTSHRQWLMQLKMCVLHQNGRIWDALSLWNSNLDKKFDGVDECYICFAVLHQLTYQLPKLACQTCKKKFHSACLYKWFSTSNKSTCPICRNLF